MSVLRRRFSSNDKSRVPCAAVAEDLLLYAHHCLSPRATKRVETHLRSCTACRSELRRLTEVSRAFAAEIRGPLLPEWQVPAAPAKTGMSLPLLVAFIVVVAAMISLSYLTISELNRTNASHAPEKLCDPSLLTLSPDDPIRVQAEAQARKHTPRKPAASQDTPKTPGMSVPALGDYCD